MSATAEQLDFFREIRPAARAKDPKSSKQAAREINATGLQGNQCRQVMQAIALWPGCTSRELSTRMSADRHMVAKRAADLLEQGLVRQGVQRKCRESGRLALTWWVEK